MNIFLKSSSGKLSAVTVSSGAALSSVCPGSDKCLVNGMVVPSASTIAHLPADCIVEPFVCLRGGITIKVQTIAGSQFDVEVDRSWTVQQLKQKLEERLNVSPEQIKLISGGKPLKESQTLEDANISAGTVVHMILQLRGG